MQKPQQSDHIGHRLIAIILFCMFGMEAIYFTVQFLISTFEAAFNSSFFNNLNYYLFSASVWAEVFWGCVMLTAAGLAALALRSEGMLRQAFPKAPFTLNTLRITTLVLALDYVVSLLIVRVLSLLSPDKSVDLIKPGYEYELSMEMLPADLFAAVIAAPIAEEFLFRGALFSALLARGANPVLTVILTSAIFAFGHNQYEWQGLILIFTGGAFLGFLRWYTGGLMAPMLCHAAYNFWMIVTDYWSTFAS